MVVVAAGFFGAGVVAAGGVSRGSDVWTAVAWPWRWVRAEIFLFSYDCGAKDE